MSAFIFHVMCFFVTVEVDFCIRQGGGVDLECIIRSVFLKICVMVGSRTKNTVGSNLYITVK